MMFSRKNKPFKLLSQGPARLSCEVSEDHHWLNAYFAAYPNPTMSMLGFQESIFAAKNPNRSRGNVEKFTKYIHLGTSDPVIALFPNVRSFELSLVGFYMYCNPLKVELLAGFSLRLAMYSPEKSCDVDDLM